MNGDTIIARARLSAVRDDGPTEYRGTLNYFGIKLPVRVRRADNGLELDVMAPAPAEAPQ